MKGVPRVYLNAIRKRERDVFSTIPGMELLVQKDPDNCGELVGEYPDAVFAWRVANSLFQHDLELSRIQQRAYFSILNGENIPSVRCRHEKELDLYLKNHMWDD